jgi:hypothetical protein
VGTGGGGSSGSVRGRGVSNVRPVGPFLFVAVACAGVGALSGCLIASGADCGGAEPCNRRFFRLFADRLRERPIDYHPRSLLFPLLGIESLR